jgi:CubicO group peptidase (beta-lactamase class C family)
MQGSPLAVGPIALAPEVNPVELNGRVAEIFNRHPHVGLALGIAGPEGLEFFAGHGLADVPSNRSITKDTVFRIGSISKLFTATAVMQLWERGQVDLDAPANDYLRAYRLVPTRPGWRPATLRHLLTHTAGIPEVVYVSDLLHPGWGPFMARPAQSSVRAGEPMPTLAEYYRGGLRIVAEPGSVFAYSNHGFATLGQIVEDVSGLSLRRYLRRHIFDPLGMAGTDLARSALIGSRVATGYVLVPRGAMAVPDRDWLGAGAGGTYSSTEDLALFAAALLGGGANANGVMLRPSTLAMMLEAHYEPDPRLPGMGLGFFRTIAGGHLVVGHEGVLPGFTSELLVCPDEGIAVVVFTNGSKGAMTWMPSEIGRLLHEAIGVPNQAARREFPAHPEVWQEVCGRYQLPGGVSDLRLRMMAGAGVQVFVRGGELMLRVLAPIPALYRGLRLHPDDAADTHAFRLDLTGFGLPDVHVIFGHDTRAGTTAMHTDFGSQPVSLVKGTAARRSRSKVALMLAPLALGVALAAARSWRRQPWSGGARVPGHRRG